MDAFARYRERLAKLLSASLAAVQLVELKELLAEIARIEDLPGLAAALERSAERGYARGQLLAEDRWELALVLLQPGERIRPHDHGCYEGMPKDGIVGLVYVAAGTELNRFFEQSDGLRETGIRTVRTGEVVELRASMIHGVENAEGTPAISLHAYIFAQGDPRTGKRRF